jgi:hypothetical protein
MRWSRSACALMPTVAADPQPLLAPLRVATHVRVSTHSVLPLLDSELPIPCWISLISQDFLLAMLVESLWGTVRAYGSSDLQRPR